MRTMARRGRKKGRRSKKSTWGKAKGLIYIGAIAGPAIVGFQQFGGMSDPVNAAGRTLMAYGGINKSGAFEPAVLAQMWTPAATVAVVDLVSSKLGIQKRIARGVSSFM